MSRLYAVPVGVLALAVCTAMERTTAFANVRVDVCAMLVAYLAYRFDVVGGAVTALVLGLLLDVTAGAPSGLHMLSLAAVFVVVRAAANAVQVQPGVRVAPVAVAAAVGHTLLVGALVGLFAEGNTGLQGLWTASLPSVLGNLVAVGPLLWLVHGVGNRVLPEPDHLFLKR